MSDVRRLRNLERRLGQTEVGERRSGGGTTFPTGISAAYRYFRTDLGFECYYDGTRWLTAHEYAATLQPYTPTVPGAAFYTGGVTANLLYHAPRTDYSLYVTRYVLGYISDTNQTAVNYWTLALATNGATITTQNTQNAVTAGNFATREGNDNADRGTPPFFRLQATAKNGAPGGIWVTATVHYRLIVT